MIKSTYSTLICIFFLSFITMSQEEKYTSDNFIIKDGLYYLVRNEEKKICNGEYNIYNENGSIGEKISVKDGKMHGMYKVYSRYGVLGNLNYLDGVLDGLSEYYNNDGSIYVRGNYKKGKKHGIHENYFQNGSLSTKEEYNDGELVYKETYRGNGSRFSVYNGKNGEMKYYYYDDSLLGKGAYKNGIPVGKWNGYHKNGKLRKTSQYKDGMLDGKFTIYYPSGKLYMDGTFKYGVISGSITYFYENGKKKSVTQYKVPSEPETYYTPKIIGISEHFNENGTLAAVIQYNHESKIILTKSYNKKGKLVEIKDFSSNTFKLYHENGKILVEKIKKDNKDQYIVYFETGEKLGTFYTFRDDGTFDDGRIPNKYFK